MNPRFKEHIEQLHGQLQCLLEAEPLSASALPKAAGIYLFSEGDKHLYVGRTNNLRKRFKNHSRPSSGHNQATFAFRLARVSTGKVQVDYSRTGSRQSLLLDPDFSAAFTAAKAQVGRMALRFIGVNDPVQQALLEIYVALHLETPGNDFDNH